MSEAIAHLQRAVDTGKPECFVQVSPSALAVLLAEQDHQGEDDAKAAGKPCN